MTLPRQGSTRLRRGGPRPARGEGLTAGGELGGVGDVRTFCPRAPSGAGSPDLEAAAARALEALPRARRLTVAVNDPQRHTASRAVLDAVSRRAPPGRMRILIASGTHYTPADQRRAFERDLCGGIAPAGLAWHDCRGELAAIGTGELAWRGHPWLLDCDAVLAVGSVEPHYFAGFTGAHKTATVGCASHADIEANHALAMSDLCRPCRLDGNPIFEAVAGMLKALQAERPVAAVNLVQAGARILAAAGGEPLETLRSATAPAEAAFVGRIDAPADALILDVTGPLGRSFYQADKALKNNEWAVRDRGCIILQAPCPDGIGQDHFVGLLLEARTYEQAASVVAARGYRLGDHKAVRLRRLTDPKCRGVRVFLVSPGLGDEQAGILGMTRSPDAMSALAAAGINPATHTVCRILDAGNFVLHPQRASTDLAQRRS